MTSDSRVGWPHGRPPTRPGGYRATRGQAARRFRGEDLLLLLIANAAVVQVTRHDAAGASRRVVAWFLEAVSAQGIRAPLPDPPSPEQMRRAMARLAGSRGCSGRGVAS